MKMEKLKLQQSESKSKKVCFWVRAEARVRKRLRHFQGQSGSFENVLLQRATVSHGKGK